MAVNITVNGKFTKHCGTKLSILDDAERRKKECSEERRKLRLQQVRAESKNIARKIRHDVAEEKERQLRNLESIKAQELDCWRQHVMAQKNHDYRTAVFQVGMAHQAAREENNKQADKGRQCGEQFRQQLRARRSCQNAENQQNKANIKKSIRNCGTQTAKCMESVMPTQTIKRKRNICFKKQEACYCCSSEDSDSETDEVLCSSLSSSTSSTSSILSTCQNSKPTTKCTQTAVKGTQLCQTPAVVLEVEVDSNDSVIITTPGEIRDRYTENNRQFSRIVRQSPQKEARGEHAKKCMQQNSKESTTNNTATTSATTSSATTSSSTTVPVASKTTTKGKVAKPRFTQVSDLIQKKKVIPVAQGPKAKSPRKARSPTRAPIVPNPSPQTSFGEASPQSSPRKSPTPSNKPPKPLPQKTLPKSQNALATQTKTTQNTLPNTSRSKSKSPTRQPTSSKSSTRVSQKSPLRISKKIAPSEPTSVASTATVTLCCAAPENTPVDSTSAGTSSCTGRVQFYDYNNKFAKDYPQPVQAVSIRPHVQAEPNAMQQANIEQQLCAARAQEIDKLRQKSDLRGQKALERERVRRDCNELTEKLDALSRQHPNLMPSDANLKAGYRFADRAKQKETKMNTAVEELLLRPTIITCPEVGKSEQMQQASNEQPTSTARLFSANDLNVGEVQAQTRGEDASSDSCCSILLGYMDDQRKQIRSDLTQPNQNKQKSEKLQNLLKRTDQLRNLLLKELKNGNRASRTNNESIQQVMHSISSLQKERADILIDGKTNEKQKEEEPLQGRERVLKQKEAILEQKVREFYEMQKSASGDPTATSNRTVVLQNKTGSQQIAHTVRSSNESPFEIIIKLTNDTKVPKKSKSQPELAKKPTSKIPHDKAPQSSTNGLLYRQNSYDSNSTSYRSLPPTIQNNIQPLVERLSREQVNNDAEGSEENEFEAEEEEEYEQGDEEEDVRIPPTRTRATPARLNPLVAHYVQRLLGMSRNSVCALGVSSSEIDTPSSSIINTTANMPALTSSNTELALSEERLERVEKFVQDNRSFINDLESSLHTQSSQSLETSLRIFEEIWKQRLMDPRKKQTSKKITKCADLLKKQQSKSEMATKTAKQTSNNSLKARAGPIASKIIAVKTSTETNGTKGVRASKTAARTAEYSEVVPIKSTSKEANGTQSQETVKSNQKSRSGLIRKDAIGADGNSNFRVSRTSTSESIRKEANVGSRLLESHTSAIATVTSRSNGSQQPEERTSEGGGSGAISRETLHSYYSAFNSTSKTSANIAESSSIFTHNAVSKETVATSSSNRREANEGSTSQLEYGKTSSQQSIQPQTSEPSISAEQRVEETAQQAERYAQLADSRSQRIAELTGLISKVRQEKQRLLEVTLSSVSSGERNSTEYLDLPEGQQRISSTSDTSATSSNTNTNSDRSQIKLLETILNDLPVSTQPSQATPLEKHKKTGTSRDSGISMSRPMTSQEQHQDMDPSSIESCHTASSSQRKLVLKPPPTLKRFSPMLIEDEVAHELSTILEVDTPATSRINTSVQPTTSKEVAPKDKTIGKTPQQEQSPPLRKCPVVFPTFEQYAEELNLDLTQFDAEQSCCIEQEFNALVAALAEARGKNAPTYQEFPSIAAYLDDITQNLQECDSQGHLVPNECPAPETIEELLNCLRLANISIKSFPSHKEYTQQRRPTNTPEGTIIGTESLENINEEIGSVTTTTSDTDSESINIEAELKRRNILKSSFRSSATQERIFSSTVRNDLDTTRGFAQTITAESGIEKFSTSDLSGELEKDLFGLGMQWPTAMRRKAKETEAFSSTTSTTVSINRRRKHTANTNNETAADAQASASNDMGRPLNLRDFLTRELLKRSANTSSSSANTDDSLRSHFINSIIGTMTTPTCTPRTYGANSNGAGITLDRERQKTSTPVVANSSSSHSRSDRTSSTSPTQLFSGESRLSSVHFQQHASVRYYRKRREEESYNNDDDQS